MRILRHACFLAASSLLETTRAQGLSAHGVGRAAEHDVCAIDSRSIVSDACASFSTLDSLNSELMPSIHALVQTTDFFSYYRLNLYNKICPFWSDEDSMCGNIACAVNTIENEQDIPAVWRAEELGKLQGPKAQHPNRKRQLEDRPLMGELGGDVGESCVVEYDDECDDRDYCVPEDESASAKGDYVSLVDNPERFTGYGGPGAHQVWEAIYRENCFAKSLPTDTRTKPSSTPGYSEMQHRAAQDLQSVMKEYGRHQIFSAGGEKSETDENYELDNECLEKRVFYRIISGMHASISMHLCWDYLNQTTGEWGPNVECFDERIHDHPERISNLYFNYALVLRAVEKARASLADYTFCSGDVEHDKSTKRKVLDLADAIASGPRIYDETLMFQDSGVMGLKDDFRARFRNVSRTMDCVGCDKCRLWGKLQTAGYGTALKILFEFQDDETSNPDLRRTELVALINTLDKLSQSIFAFSRFKAMHTSRHEHDKLPLATGESHGHEAVDDLEEELDVPVRRKENSSIDVFWQEWDDVWRTFKWVIRRWIALPKELVTILALELNRLWAYWLGLPVTQVHWEIRKPWLKDEV